MEEELARPYRISRRRSGALRPLAAEAERRARIEFGGHARFKEEMPRSRWAAISWRPFFSDLRFCRPLPAQVSWLHPRGSRTLALGIGANAVVFSVLNALILRPLNVPQPESLYALERVQAQLCIRSPTPTTSICATATAASTASPPITSLRSAIDTGNNPSRLALLMRAATTSTSSVFSPILGRFFHASDENGPEQRPLRRPQSSYWHSHFQGDPAVVGRTVQINKHPFTIIGVAPPAFRGSELFFAPDFWVPMVESASSSTDGISLTTAAITRPMAVWPPEARRHSGAGHRRSQHYRACLERPIPRMTDKMSFSLARPGLVGDLLGGPARAFMAGLMLLAGLILLAACANLGSLFAARAADRSREVALRLALGSRRSASSASSSLRPCSSRSSAARSALGGVALLRLLSTWQPIPEFPVNVPVNA